MFFKKSSSAEQRKDTIMKVVSENMTDDLEGIVIGFFSTPDTDKNSLLLSLNGKEMSLGIDLANALKILMSRKDCGAMLAAALMTALHARHPDLVKCPKEAFAEALFGTSPAMANPPKQGDDKVHYLNPRKE